MSEKHNNEPRPQYYNFAHIVLPEIFTRDSAKFMATMRQNGVEFLRYVWKQVGEYENVEQPTEAVEQIKLENRTLETAYVTIITLPPPENPTEAHFVTAVFDPIQGASRYFTLEHGQALENEPDARTVFCEWQDNRHMNYGDGSKVDTQAFLALILKKLEATN